MVQRLGGIANNIRRIANNHGLKTDQCGKYFLDKLKCTDKWVDSQANIDRLRFTFGVQALVETTSKGDRNPSEVRLLVQIQRNGGWVTEK
ncbi:hypothetical protein DBP23_07550, partial [Enterobacter sp. EC-NT1]